MTDTQALEIPLVFDCAGDSLVGVVHRPAKPGPIGVVVIIAGGPQYRGGVGRGMVSMARDLCAAGVPVMRFDYRGMGDSSGDFRGFEDLAEDMQAAVGALRDAVPEVQEVVLWGGCDAASGAMIHGWKIPAVSSLVLGNPWVFSHEVQAVVLRQHYLSRLTDWSFWHKVLRFEYNIFEYAQGAVAKIFTRIARLLHVAQPDSAVKPDEDGDFVDRMLDGLGRFEGRVLFLMSGQSMLSREFDELVSTHAGWREIVNRPGYQRTDFPEADQTFSTKEAREDASCAIGDWVSQLQQGRTWE